MFKKDKGEGNGRGRAYRRRLERGSRRSNNHQREENPGFRVTGVSPAGKESHEIPGFHVIGISPAGEVPFGVPGFHVIGVSSAGEVPFEVPGFYVIGVSPADDSATTKPDAKVLKAAQEEIRQLMTMLNGTSRSYVHILQKIEEVLESISGDRRMKLWLGKWKELGAKKATTKGAYLTCLNDIHGELSASIEEAERGEQEENPSDKEKTKPEAAAQELASKMADAVIEAAQNGDPAALGLINVVMMMDAMGLLEDE